MLWLKNSNASPSKVSVALTKKVLPIVKINKLQ